MLLVKLIEYKLVRGSDERILFLIFIFLIGEMTSGYIYTLVVIYYRLGAHRHKLPYRESIQYTGWVGTYY